IIDSKLLEDIALSIQGQLTIMYCLSEPPPNWVPYDNQKYEDFIINVGSKSESVFSAKIQDYSLLIQILANAEESYGLLQGNLIVSGPSSMLRTVE
ncbi:9262_t:CDS:2, partial [Gigaspora margarita]